MIKITDLSKCCGCAACASVCPKGAIRMTADEKGFFYPVVEEALCIECGLCEKVCAFTKERDSEPNIQKAYALKHLSKEVLKKSSSGGAFTALSDFILSEGGAVFGAKYEFSPKIKVVHDVAFTKEERDLFLQSKYVQSETEYVFKKVKTELQKGKPVLFSGTPCECAALQSYLVKDYENLYTVDLLCHGVPSVKLLQEHVALYEEKYREPLKNFYYRSKKYGVGYNLEAEFESGKRDISVEMRRLIKLYSLSMRESCYACPYASKNRTADLTIGDLFESGKVAKIYDDEGTSLVFVNTEKGKKLFSQIEKNAFTMEVEKNQFHYQALSHPVKKEQRVELFWKEYFEKGYPFVLEKYAHQTLKSTVYQNFLRVMHKTRLNKLYSYLLSKK